MKIRYAVMDRFVGCRCVFVVVMCPLQTQTEREGGREEGAVSGDFELVVLLLLILLYYCITVILSCRTVVSLRWRGLASCVLRLVSCMT